VKIVVLGSSGQLACSLKKTQRESFDVTYLSRDIAPFEDFGKIQKQLEIIRPTHVINTVAYTKVDLAETEKDICFQINSDTPSKIAKWCLENESLFFHYSTDYVFDGNKSEPWNENDKPHPINIYGKSKLASEEAILKLDNSYVFRTSWIYSEFGKNFVKTMISLMQEKEELSVVTDQIGGPNYGADLANATWNILSQSTNPGLYHMSSQNFCSWYEFAVKIQKNLTEFGLKTKIRKINPINSKDYKTPADRPLNSRLDSHRLKNTFGIELPNWEISLKTCMKEILKGQIN
jgi:dTDP-4-dehydrorhamnose reductase